MHRFFLPFVTLILIAMGVALSSCASSIEQDPEAESMTVSASFYPVAFIAQSVGGQYVQVIQITPGAMEPHEYEPTPLDIADIEKSDLFLWNGYGVDGWASKVSENIIAKGHASVQVAKDLATRTFIDGDDEHHSDASKDASIDPHVWLDPTLMMVMTERVRDAFIQQDSEHADAYRTNAEQLLSRLKALHESYTTGLSQCERNLIVTSHDAFGYLADRYHLSIASIAGISPDEEPSPATMADIIDTIRREKVTTVFFETLVSPRLAETIAKETGATQSVLNPIEGLTDVERADQQDYLSLMKSNLGSLQIALSCH